MARPCAGIHPQLVPAICYYCWLFASQPHHQIIAAGLSEESTPPTFMPPATFVDYPAWYYDPPSAPPADTPGSGSGSH